MANKSCGYDVDEWYPVFSIVSDAEAAYNDERAEFTDEELLRIQAAFDEFHAAQELISTRFEEMRKSRA